MNTETDYSHLREWLLPKIEERGLSIEEFADRLTLSRVIIYKYLHDQARPRTQTMAKICHFLNVPLEEGLAQYTARKPGPKGKG